MEFCKENFEKALKQEDLDEICLYALGGEAKRIRPYLVFMAATAGDPMAAALAVEYLHTATLIIDDLPCMDDSDERRGRPTLHKVFGESSAILASYSLIADAYKLVASMPIAVELVSRAMGRFGVTGGQIMDLQLEAPSEEKFLTTCRMKTGALFSLSLQLGSLFGNEKRNWREIGEQFGILFQLLNDIKGGDGSILFFGRSWVDDKIEKTSKLLEKLCSSLLSLVTTVRAG